MQQFSRQRTWTAATDKSRLLKKKEQNPRLRHIMEYSKFIRMTFGLKMAPGTDQDAMDVISSTVHWQLVNVYLDDTVILWVTYQTRDLRLAATLRCWRHNQIEEVWTLFKHYQLLFWNFDRSWPCVMSFDFSYPNLHESRHCWSENCKTFNGFTSTTSLKTNF